jgi:Extensin-like protein C-terminus
MRLNPLAAGAALGLAVACAARASLAGFGAPTVPPDSPSPEGPAAAYARLDRSECFAELAQRGIPFAPVDAARGVLAPIRVLGPLHGVTFRTALPDAQRATTPWEIADCRLALSLDDFAAILSSHDVVDVVHFSIYRPPGEGWPVGKIASRHPGALAIDAAQFIKRDGHALVVERDFHGRIGAKTCGAGAGPRVPGADASELRQIVCDTAAAKIFNVELTPDFNWAHRNHLHLEVTAGARWFMVH